MLLSLQERFEQKYLPVPECGCWLWTDNVDASGYGQMHVNRKPARAHRVSWELRHGPIPAGLCVLHHCDVRCCVNPAHLFLGDRRDNKLDCMAKQRHARGTSQGSSKLTISQVSEIRRLSEAGVSTRSLGRQFGVSNVTIAAIARGERYKDHLCASPPP